MTKSKSKSSKPRNPKPKTKQVPSTPTDGIRRFFFKLELLGKRQVDHFRAFSHWHHNCDANKTPTQHTRLITPASATIGAVDKEDLPIEPSLAASSAYHPTHTHTHAHTHAHNFHEPVITNRFNIALQNHDMEHPDTIIITTLNLDAPPFCCHEELLSMPRLQLLAVADLLNAKLPSALAIDTSATRPESWIRSEIEWIVGIRDEREPEIEIQMKVPGAPKAVRTWSSGSWYGEDDFDILKDAERTPPTSPSPLTRKSLQMSPRSPRLERLAEEDEEGSESLVLISKVGRAAKTKRADGKAVKRRKVESTKEADINVDDKFDLTPKATAQRMPRLRSSSAAAFPNVSPTPLRVLRSHSYNLGKKPNIDTVFGRSASTRCPRSKSNDSSEAVKFSKLATPRKTRTLRPPNGYLPFLAPVDGRSRASSTSTSTSTSSSLWGLDVTDSPMSRSNTAIGIKRKRSIRDGEEEEMASGMRGMNMNMGMYTEDMDDESSL